MNKFLTIVGFKLVASLLDGYKTYVGGSMLMLLGIGKIGAAVIGIAGGMFPDVATSTGVSPITIDTAMPAFQAGNALFGLGLAACGIGHKIEKQKS